MKLKLLLILYAVSISLKLIGYLKTNYLILLAESFHNLTDVMIILNLLYALRVASKPADYSHPLGHGLAVNIGSLIAGVAFITIISYELVKEGVSRIFYEVEYGEGAYLYMLASMLPIVLAFFVMEKRGVAERTAKMELRNDILSGFSATVGVLAAERFAIIDSIFTIFIAAIIGYSGYMLVRENSRILMGASPDEEFYDKVREIAESFEEVHSVHDVIATYMGENKIHVDMHVVVDGDMTVREADRLTEKIAKKMMENLPELGYVTIHVCAEEKDRLKSTYEKIMGEI